MLIARVGKLEQYRSEKALVGALAGMYVQGVSTRKVKAVTEELCGHELRPLQSAASMSAWMRSYPYVFLDTRYEKVREDGVIRSQAEAKLQNFSSQLRN